MATNAYRRHRRGQCRIRIRSRSPTTTNKTQQNSTEQNGMELNWKHLYYGQFLLSCAGSIDSISIAWPCVSSPPAAMIMY